MIKIEWNTFENDCMLTVFYSIQCLQTKEKLEDTTEQFISIQNDLLSGEEQIGCDTNGEDCSRILFLSQGGFDFQIY